MQADTHTLKDILVGDRRFTVPPYQRPYVWERDRQWAPLWDDVEDTLARLAESRVDAHAKGHGVADGDEHTAPHFMGAIVLDQLPTPAGGIDRRAVVDGQQRLTTTQLMLRGVLDAITERGASTQQLAQVRKMIRNDDDVLTEPDMAFKVWPRRSERDAFRAAMDSQAPPADRSRFANARSFFAEAAGAWLDDPSSPSDPFVDDVMASRIGLLTAVVRDLLKLVVIDLDGIDDAQVIFEVLNARHTPLTAADLVKNLLFMRAETEGLDVEALYDEHWAHFDDEWWATEIGIGHATRARQDFLLGDWLVATTGSSVSVSHLYGVAKAHISRGPQKIPDVLQSISTYAKAYRKLGGLEDEDLDPAERRAFAHIRTLNVTAANPLLLWLLTRPSDELARADRTHAVTAIESYFVRRMATKWQTRAYVTVFVDILKSVQRPGVGVLPALLGALNSGPQGYRWPSDDEIRTSFVETRAYGAGGPQPDAAQVAARRDRSAPAPV